jgi:hypothetical protein
VRAKFNAAVMDPNLGPEVSIPLGVEVERLSKLEPVAPPRERTPNIVARAGARAYLQYINLREFMPQAKAKMSAGYALDLIHTLTRESPPARSDSSPKLLKEPSGAPGSIPCRPPSGRTRPARHRGAGRRRQGRRHQGHREADREDGKERGGAAGRA